MKEIVFIAPIPPGKMAMFMQFVQALNTARRAEFEEQQKRLRLTRHDIWLQKTPFGDFAIMAQDGADIRETRRIIRASTEPFDIWFKQQILEIHGADLSRTAGDPRPQLCVEYRPGSL